VDICKSVPRTRKTLMRRIPQNIERTHTKVLTTSEFFLKGLKHLKSMYSQKEDTPQMLGNRISTILFLSLLDE